MKSGWEWISCPICESTFQIPDDHEYNVRCPRCKNYIDAEDFEFPTDDDN